MSRITTRMIVCLFLCATCASAQDTSRRYLEYNYATMTLRVCDGDAEHCDVYPVSQKFFLSGDVLQLRIRNYPLLSVFQVQVDDKVINPVRPFLRGVSDAEAPAANNGNVQDSGKALSLAAVSDDIEKKRAGIRKGNASDLDDAIVVLLKQERALDASIDAVLNSLFVHAAPNSYPGPTWDDARNYANVLLQDWSEANGAVTESHFENLVERTTLLTDTVKDLNARLKMATANASLSTLRDGYTTLVLDATTVLNDARNSTSTEFQKAGENALREPSSQVDPLSTFLKQQDVQIRPAPFLTGNPNAELSYAAGLVRASSTRLKAIERALQTPSDLADTMARIFARANTIYETARVADVQVITVGQWSGSHALKVALQETKGFTRFAFADAAAGEQAGNASAGGSDGSTPVSPAVDNGDTADKQKAADGGSDPKPDQPPAAPAAKTVFQFGVNVHQIVRGNVVSGFARSSLSTREYTLKTVPAVDSNGNPVLDSNGKPTTAKVPVIARDEPGQYLYYIGLNFYLKPRDSFPHATPRSAYFWPGAMFAYGVNEESNFLLGLNWETSWGLNFGGGVHWGHETVLAAAYSKDGITPDANTQLPSDTTAAPTTSRFNKNLYLSVGFDASVFQKVWSAVKGVKPGS